MTIMPRSTPNRAKKNRSRQLFEKGMALLASANLALVLFDLSYIPLRNFWLQGRVQLYARINKYEWTFPAEPVRVLPTNITQHYDWVKGIEPNRDTSYYLQRVAALREELEENGVQVLQSPVAVEDGIPAFGDRQSLDEQPEPSTEDPENEDEDIFEELQRLSVEMIDSNPFEIADKSGTLEKIKNRMRRHIFEDVDASSKDAFRLFWSREYLLENGWVDEFEFYDAEIKPLLDTNYYRPIGENGNYINNFGLLDFPFFLLFLLEFLARSWYISRRRTGVSWFDAMLWRWYDIFLLIPLFRWLRVIPVVTRLDQSNLINLSAIQKQASQGFVASIAEDITEVVFIRLINQVQGSINRGEFSSLVAQTTNREYVDLNNVNEPVEIAKLVANLLVHQVLPTIRPEAEAVIRHTIERVVSLTPAYQGLQLLPGFNEINGTLAQQLSHQLYEITADTLIALLEEDPELEKLFEALMSKLSESVTSEIQAQESLTQMESLINDFLEEVKVNYVERLSEEDVEDILDQTRALRQNIR